MKSLGVFLVGVTLLAGPAMAQNYESTIRDESMKLVNAMRSMVNLHQEILDELTDEFVIEIGDDAIQLRRNIAEFVQAARDIQRNIENEWTGFRYARTPAEYNRWVDWYNNKAKIVRSVSGLAEQCDFGKQFNDSIARYNQERVRKHDQLQGYVDLMLERLNEIIKLHKAILEDPIVRELSERPLNLDAYGEIINAYEEYGTRLKIEIESWDALRERLAAVSSPNGFDASINVLLNHFNYLAFKKPTADVAHRFLDQKLRSRPVFAYPDVSEPLARYRKAASVLEYLSNTQERLVALQRPITPDNVAFDIMSRMANILGEAPEARSRLDRFSQVNAQYAEQLRTLPNLDKLKQPGEDVFVAARLIAAEAELRTFFDRLVELHDDVTGKLFMDVRSLRAEWVNAYLFWLKSDIESNIARLRDFEVHLLEWNVAAGFNDTDALLAALQAQLKAEQAGLNLVDEASAIEKSRSIGSLQEWAVSFKDLPFTEGDGSRLDGLVKTLLDFEGLPSTDPSLYLARCDLALTLSPSNSLIRHEQAFQLNRLGRHAEAEAILLDLYTAEPTRQDFAVSLASSYEGQGKEDAAEALFRNMLADTQSVELSTVQAWLRFAHRQGKLTEALQGWEGTFAVRGEQEAFSRMLMQVQTYAGDWRAATLAFEALPEGAKTSEDWKDYVNLGLSSEDVYTRAMLAASEDPDAVEHRISMAHARIGQGRMEEARDLLDAIGLENTAWELLLSWILFTDIIGSEELSDRLNTRIDAIEGAEARDLMRAFRLVAKEEYGAVAALLEPYEWPHYYHTRFLRARAAAGLGDRETALVILDKLDDEMGFEFEPAISLKFQLQVLKGSRAEAKRTLERMGGTSAPDCPIWAFYRCLYETRFGTRREALRLKNDSLAAYPGGLTGVSGVWYILPESLARFDRAGAIPVKVWAFAGGGLLLAGLLALGLLRAARAASKAAPDIAPSEEKPCQSRNPRP